MATSSRKGAKARSSRAKSSSSAGKSLRPGDKVEWNSSGGHSVGKVVKKLGGTTKIKGHVAKPSKGNPEYLVRSDKSGKTAAHKPSELKKRSR